MNDIIEILKKEKDELVNKISLLDELIAKLSKSATPVDASSENTHTIKDINGYPATGVLSDKMNYVFKRENRFLHIREIAKLIIAIDPNYNNENELVDKLSPLLTRYKKAGEITSRKANPSNLSVFWGSPKWENEDGSIKNEHIYNESVVLGSRKGLNL